jgi:ABC-type sugar transport system ATPase subunit
MRDIRKSFGDVEVLHGVGMEVRPGEVHALAGENGAGKSTLVKILSGAYADYTGDLFLAGLPCRFTHPSQASRAGIATIHQELSLVPSMTVADNLFLGHERTVPWKGVDDPGQRERARQILEGMGIHATPDQRVEDLPIATQQLLEIARALMRDASVVIFDEPTSALAEREVEVLFHRIRELKDRQCGIVYITHKMAEIYRLADRITVLRDGAVVGTAPPGDLPPAELVRWMVGRELATGVESPPQGREPRVLRVGGLRVAHPRVPGRWVVADVDLEIRRGEILGLAGLQGSGASEVCEALFGALGDRVEGRVELDGEPLPLGDPRASVEKGLVFLANDRKALGLAPDQSVVHSVSLMSLRRFSPGLGWVRRGQERGAVARQVREFRLRAPSLDAPVRALSGGNQQKVYLARCLLAEPKVLLLDEPTRGIDVGAKADIYQLMGKWVEEGVGILLITSEMDELLALSHRILVMHRGRVMAEFGRDEVTKDRILAAAMGQGVGPGLHDRSTGPGAAT